ncbi:hypothetical protein QE152_g38089 [Popillia japonica]|uniref:Uncharacterized protein n=1 Tax=Popillia japonica TaxID=7064 RepID=A0AAW1I942_POPJA
MVVYSNLAKFAIYKSYGRLSSCFVRKGRLCAIYEQCDLCQFIVKYNILVQDQLKRHNSVGNICDFDNCIFARETNYIRQVKL